MCSNLSADFVAWKICKRMVPVHTTFQPHWFKPFWIIIERLIKCFTRRQPIAYTVLYHTNIIERYVKSKYIQNVNAALSGSNAVIVSRKNSNKTLINQCHLFFLSISTTLQLFALGGPKDWRTNGVASWSPSNNFFMEVFSWPPFSCIV